MFDYTPYWVRMAEYALQAYKKKLLYEDMVELFTKRSDEAKKLLSPAEWRMFLIYVRIPSIRSLGEINNANQL